MTSFRSSQSPQTLLESMHNRIDRGRNSGYSEGKLFEDAEKTTREKSSRRPSERDQRHSMSSQRQQSDDDQSETTEILSNKGWRKVTREDQEYCRRQSNRSSKRASVNEADPEAIKVYDQPSPEDYRNDLHYYLQRSAEKSRHGDDPCRTSMASGRNDNSLRASTRSNEEYIGRKSKSGSLDGSRRSCGNQNCNNPRCSELASDEYRRDSSYSKSKESRRASPSPDGDYRISSPMNSRRSSRDYDNRESDPRSSAATRRQRSISEERSESPDLRNRDDCGRGVDRRQQGLSPRGSEFSSITEAFGENGWHPITESEKQGLRRCVQQAKEEKAAADRALQRKKQEERFQQQVLASCIEHPTVDYGPPAYMGIARRETVEERQSRVSATTNAKRETGYCRDAGAPDDNVSEASTEVLTKTGWRKLSEVGSVRRSTDERRPTEQPMTSQKNSRRSSDYYEKREGDPCCLAETRNEPPKKDSQRSLMSPRKDSQRSLHDFEKRESVCSRNEDVRRSVKSNRGDDYRPSEQLNMSPKEHSRRSFNDYEKRESARSINEGVRRPSDKSNRGDNYCPSYCPSEMSTEVFTDNEWRKIGANDCDAVRRGSQDRRQTHEVAAAKSEASESEISDCNAAPRRRSSTFAASREHGDSTRVSMRQSVTPQDGLRSSSHRQDLPARDDCDSLSETDEENDPRWIEVKLDLKTKEHVTVAEGIVWDFDDAGAFVKRFKPEIECSRLVQNVRPKDRLCKINTTLLKRKSKAEIMQLWCDAQEQCNGHLTLQFLP